MNSLEKCVAVNFIEKTDDEYMTTVKKIYRWDTTKERHKLDLAPHMKKLYNTFKSRGGCTSVIASTVCKNTFGTCLDNSLIKPIIITKQERPISVIMWIAEYDRLVDIESRHIELLMSRK